MVFLHYVLLLCFINVYNSFTLINKKYFPNFLSRDCRYKLNMSCDYYIDKNLELYDHNDIMFLFINLEHQRGYYLFSSALDEDQDEYDATLDQYIKEILHPIMKPIVIYSNNMFNKISSENKYKKLVEDQIKFFNKTLNDVSKIVKIENRYETW